MDICVVTYRMGADRILPALRPVDRLFVRDNTSDNIGFAAGANWAARQGTNALIAFVNPDGDPAPDCFAQLENEFADPTVVAVEAEQGSTWDRPRLNPEGDMVWLSGACMAVRRAAFEMVGGFDERLFMYGEDVDLSFKLARLGRLRHCSAAFFAHDSGRRSFSALHRNFRNWLIVMHRHSEPDPVRMLRDAFFAGRRRRLRECLARITGVADYELRGKYWA